MIHSSFLSDGNKLVIDATRPYTKEKGEDK